MKKSQKDLAAVFKIEYWHSDGLGVTSNQRERVVDVVELRDMFGEIFTYIEKWIIGQDNFEIEIDSEDEYTTIQTTEGSLCIEFSKRYRAGGYDDSPVYRSNTDVYVITYN